MHIQGVKKVIAKGRAYYYHRATGKRIAEEPGAEFGTAGFLAKVEALNGKAPAALAAKTLGGLIAAYRASDKFTDLAPRTRRDYQRVFDYMRGAHDMPTERIDEEFLLKLQDQVYRKHKRRFANYVIQVLRLLFAWGKPRGWIKHNPAIGIGMIRRPRKMPKANRPWTDEERRIVLAEAPARIKPGIALGMFAGLREGDAVIWPWSAYDGTAIEGIQAKTGEPIWLPAARELREILDATPRRSPIIMTGERGQPYTGNGFRAEFFKLIRRLVKAGTVQPGLTFHGLRHTLGKLLADAGSDDRDIMAVLGHETPAMAQHYTKGADRRRRATAAIKRFDRAERKRNGNLTNPVENPATTPPKVYDK